QDAVVASGSVAALFFFKQKTAYELSRDWSSDVCSSDLPCRAQGFVSDAKGNVCAFFAAINALENCGCTAALAEKARGHDNLSFRSEERRVGKECRSRRAADPGARRRRTPHEQPGGGGDR